MNPFDFHGPEFLAFYIILSVVVHIALYAFIKQKEESYPIPKLSLNDPYEIAFLRGGREECIRIVMLSLIDRGLLNIEKDGKKSNLRTTNEANVDIVNRPIEKAILKVFLSEVPIHKAFEDKYCMRVCDEYMQSLGKHNLVRTPQITQARLVATFIAGAVLISVGAIKIFIAVARGKSNFIFLLGLIIFSIIMLSRIVKKQRTALGDVMIKDLKELFKSLYVRRGSLKAGGQTNEVALLAAVFGTSCLPLIFIYAGSLKPLNSGYNYGSSCGYGCGSGGCGGGCGGCGS